MLVNTVINEFNTVWMFSMRWRGRNTHQFKSQTSPVPVITSLKRPFSHPLPLCLWLQLPHSSPFPLSATQKAPVYSQLSILCLPIYSLCVSLVLEGSLKHWLHLLVTKRKDTLRVEFLLKSWFPSHWEDYRCLLKKKDLGKKLQPKASAECMKLWKRNDYKPILCMRQLLPALVSRCTEIHPAVWRYSRADQICCPWELSYESVVLCPSLLPFLFLPLSLPDTVVLCDREHIHTQAL